MDFFCFILRPMPLVSELFHLFRVFFLIGSITFGGGIAMIPILERELIKKRQWMTADQMVDWFAIGQCTPGVIAVNVATFIGFYRKGFLGALAATAGIVTPSLIIITALSFFLDSFAEIELVQKALRGINVAVAVLLVSALWSFGKKTILDAYTAGIAVLAFVLMAFLNVSAVFIVCGAGVFGFLFARFRKPAGKAASEEEGL